jgi:RNA polymerase-binding transcription factor DksA
MEKRGIACFPTEDGFKCEEMRGCAECGEWISRERLRAEPTTTLCAECKTRLEKAPKAGHEVVKAEKLLTRSERRARRNRKSAQVVEEFG